MKPLTGRRLLAAIVTLIVGAAVVAAFLLLDPPGVQRQRKLDARRVRDLMTLRDSVTSYWERAKHLPPDLSTLERQPGLHPPLRDPDTGVAYGYEVTASTGYRLCTVFALETPKDPRDFSPSRKWAHGPGRQCFDLTLPTEGKTSGQP